MAPRSDFHSLLKTILESNNVWFQPDSTFRLSYPCIIYKLDDIETEFADNVPIFTTVRYQVTLIDEDADSLTRAKISALPMCIFDRFYTANQMNHWVFNIYF